MKKLRLAVLVSSLIGLFCFNVSAAGFVIGVMQDKAGDANKYEKLKDYFKSKGVALSFLAIKDYSSAVAMFSAGNINSMFSGSGVAGALMMKDIASPLVRPVTNEGWSTYWAVVLAKKGSPEFNYDGTYFKGKKIAFCGLASSGEFYFQSIPDALENAGEINIADSHGAAMDMLNNGQVDIAIVKNRVWDKAKDKYADIVQIGRDSGQNPDGTLMVSKKLDKKLSNKIEKILLGLKNDSSPAAKAVKESLKITEYIKTTEEDFKTTMSLLKWAGVDQSFDFKYSYSDKSKQ